MGIYNNWALRLRIMDHLVDEIDKDYLAGLMTHKQRQFLYKDLGTKLGLKDLLPLMHPRKMAPQMAAWKKRKAKERLGLDPERPLAEQQIASGDQKTSVPLLGKRRRKAVMPEGTPVAVKVHI